MLLGFDFCLVLDGTVAPGSAMVGGCKVKVMNGHARDGTIHGRKSELTATLSLPMPPRIHTVFFNAILTIVKPRHPAAIQYAKIFSEYLGPIPSEAVAASLPAGEPPSLQHIITLIFL